MQIRYKATGEMQHVAQNDPTTQMLIKAGLVEVVPPPAIVYGVKFSVVLRDCYSRNNGQGQSVPADKTVAIQMVKTPGDEINWYMHHPSGAKESFKRMGFDCPQDVLDQYKKIWGKDQPNLAPKDERKPQRNGQGILVGDWGDR